MKKKTLRAAEQDREDIAAEREAYRERSKVWDPARVVFLDEAGVTTKMTRLYGRSMRGERARDSAPHGHWCVRTLIGSIRKALLQVTPQDAASWFASCGYTFS